MLILFLIPIYISSFKEETTFFKPIIVHLSDKDLYLDLEDYIVGVVAAEMPASFHDEALKAQAVASRSFALAKLKDNMVNLSSSINDQVYQTNYELYDKWKDNYDNYYKKIQLAVMKTKDLVIKRDGKILKTYYFSMSNGMTENSNTVFKENTFESVDSHLDKNLKNYEVQKEVSADELKKVLNLNNIEIGNITRNKTNHVDTIVISGKEYGGIEFRKLLNLRSTDFDIIKVGNKIIITTRGYGHGVGMSQYGANEMARQGDSFEKILMHYYQKTTLSKINV